MRARHFPSLLLLLLLLSFLLLLPTTSSLTFPSTQSTITLAQCEAIPSSHIYDNACYVFDTKTQTFAAARAACRALGVGWDVASFTSLGENQFVAERRPRTDVAYWGAAVDANREGTWLNVDGTDFLDFVHWDGGTPVPSTLRNCMVMDKYTDAWAAVGCTASYGHVCKARVSGDEAWTRAECHARGGRVFEDVKCLLPTKGAGMLHDAIGECREKGMELWAPQSSDELEFVAASFTHADSYWTQINDVFEEGAYEHFDGSRIMSSLPWDALEPDDSSDAEECVATVSGSGKLGDTSCRNSRAAICQAFTLPTQPIALHPGNAVSPQEGLVWRPDNKLEWPAARMPFHGGLTGRTLCWWTRPDADMLPGVWQSIFTTAIEEWETRANWESRRPQVLMYPGSTDFYISDSTPTTDDVVLTPPVSLPHRVWSHVCLVHRVGLYAVYVDGVIAESTSSTTGPEPMLHSLVTGGVHLWADAPVDGFGLRYWPTALSSQRVKDEYLATRASVPWLPDAVTFMPSLSKQSNTAAYTPLQPTSFRAEDGLEWPSEILDFDDGFTGRSFCFWANPDSTLVGAYSAVFASVNSGDSATARRPAVFFIPSSTRFYIADSTLSSSSYYLSTSTSLPVNTWSHVCISHKKNFIALFIDGSRVSSRTDSSGPQDMQYDVFTGAYATRPSANVDLYDFRYFSRALTDAEVAVLYQEPGLAYTNTFPAALIDHASTKFTWMLWLRMTSTDADQVQVFHKGTGTPSLVLDGTTLSWKLGSAQLDVDLPPVLHEWIHLAVRVSGSTIIAYVRGHAVTDTPNSGVSLGAVDVVITDSPDVDVRDLTFVPRVLPVEDIRAHAEVGVCSYLAFGARDTMFSGADIDLDEIPFTASLWFAATPVPGSVNDDAVIFSHGTDGATNRQLYMGIENGNTIFCDMYNNRISHSLSGSSPTSFAHYACVYDSDTGQRSLYHNGVEVASDNMGLGKYANGGEPLLINNHQLPPTYGKLAYLGIWKRALSAAEIARQYSELMYDIRDAAVLYGMDRSNGVEMHSLAGSVNPLRFDRVPDGQLFSSSDPIPQFGGRCPRVISCDDCAALHVTQSNLYSTNTLINLDGTSFSFAAWFRGDAGGTVSDDTFVSHGRARDTNRNFYMGYRDKSRVIASLWNNDLLFEVDEEAYAEWHHFAASYDTGTGEFVLYYDGVKAVSGNAGAKVYGAGNTVLYINPDASIGIAGSIDDLGVWSTVLGPRDVARLYQEGSYEQSKLVAFYNMEEVDGASLLDASPNQHNLKLGAGQLGVFRREPFPRSRTQGTTTSHQCAARGSVAGPWNKYCYRWFGSLVQTFDSARASCRALGFGWDLVSIRDLYESDYVATEVHGGSRAYYIGLSDRTDEGFHRFTDGTRTGYTRWDTGEPDNLDCVVASTKTWYDSSCTRTEEFVCKAKINDAPGLLTPSECVSRGGVVFEERKCLHLSDALMSYSSAIDYCAALDMELFAPETPSQFAFVQSMVSKEVWTQIYGFDGLFANLDGSVTVNPIPWAPANTFNVDSLCGVLVPAGNGGSSGLQSSDCTRDFHVMCQARVEGPLQISGVSISPDGSWVTAGDTVRVSFTVSRYVRSLYAEILGHIVDAQQEAGLRWTAEYTITDDDDTQESVSFDIIHADGRVKDTTDGTVAPIVNPVLPVVMTSMISTTNVDSSWATIGDDIVVNFTTNEPLDVPASSVIFFVGAGAAERAVPVVSLGGNAYSATHTAVHGEPQGPIAYTIKVFDGLGASSSHSDSGAFFESGEGPTISNVELSSSMGSTARSGAVLIVSFNVNEPTESAVVTFFAGSGDSEKDVAAQPSPTATTLFTATLTVLVPDPQGAVALSISAVDLSSNTGMRAGVDIGNVIVDTRAPSYTSVQTFVEGDASVKFVQVSDSVTLSVQSNEALSEMTVSASIGAVTMSASAEEVGALEWRVDTTIPTEIPASALVHFELDMTDVAGNAVTREYVSPLRFVTFVSGFVASSSSYTAQLDEYGSALAYAPGCADPGTHVLSTSVTPASIFLSPNTLPNTTHSAYSSTTAELVVETWAGGGSSGDTAFVLLNSSSRTGSVTVSFRCTPMISLSPSTIDFGTQDVDSGTAAGSHIITVANAGSEDLTISFVTFGHSVFALETPSLPHTIDVGRNELFELSFDPSAVTTYDSTITFVSDSPASVPDTVILAGIGTRSRVAVNVSTVNFGDAVYRDLSAPIPVRVTSSGESPLVISAIEIGGNNLDQFSAEFDGTLPITLASGESLVVQVRVSPTTLAVSTLSASLAIYTSDPTNERPLVGLYAVPVGPLEAAASSVHFGTSVVLRREPTQITLTLTNRAKEHSVQVLSSEVSSPLGDELPITATNVSADLAPGEQVDVTLTFAPEQAGTYSGQLFVATNVPGHVVVVELGGVAEAAQCSLSQDVTVLPTSGGLVNVTLTLDNVGRSALRLEPELTLAIGRFGFGETFQPAGYVTCVQGPGFVALSDSALMFNCTVPSGVGAEWDVVARSGSVCGFTDPERAGQLSFLPPKLTPSSAQLVEGDGSDTNGLVSLTSNSQVEVRLHGSNFGATASRTLVVYTQLDASGTATTAFLCQVQSISHDELVCRTQGFEDVADTSRNLTFTVVVDGQQTPPDFSNALLLFAAPVIKGIRGCVDSPDGISTSQCPVGGGVQLEISGGQFAAQGSDLQVLVGGKLCRNLTVLSGEKLTCTLPDGRGANVGVTPVSVTNCTFGGKVRYGSSANLLSYVGPAVTGISSPGCRSVSALELADCPTVGNVVLHVEGNDFGTEGWTVTVGGSECESPTSDDFGASLTCTLPSGTATERRVTVVDESGQASTTGALVSYRQCPRGQYLDGIDCFKCPNGTFTSTTGRTACENCTIGRAAPLEGQEDCAVCEEGKFAAVEGAIECLPCPTGTVQPLPEKGACDECQPGRYSDVPGLPTCLQCEAGSIAELTRSTGCTRCPNGTLEQDSRKACVPCPVGSASVDPTRDECELCDPGKFSNETGLSSCFECPIGTSQVRRGGSLCLPCDKGSFSNRTGLAECDACPAGSVSRERGALECVPCDVGTLAVDGTQCLPCAAGKFSTDPADSQCELCPAGWYAPDEGMSECLPCQPGTHQGQRGQGQCLNCTIGSFSDDPEATSCDPCPPGWFVDSPGATQCKPCKAGTHQRQSGQAICVDCAPGSFSDEPEATECEPCEVGSFADEAGAEACRPCPPGMQQALAGQAVCQNCTSGRWSNVTGASECDECPPGSIAGSLGARQCERCPRGTTADSGVRCRLCDAGKAASSPEQACAACSPGRYAPEAGLSSCVPCPQGTEQALAGQELCFNCPVGRFSDAIGSEQCTSCEPGKVAAQVGSRTCTQCSTGTIAVSGRTCQPCPIGTFSNDPAAETCVDCPAGEVAATAGLASCSKCPPGRFIDREGGAVCLACARGRFASTDGARSCDQCPDNFAAETEGARICHECPPLSFTERPGQSQCASCPSGRYTVFYEDASVGPNRTFKACRECPAGSTCNGEGAVVADSDVWVVRSVDGSVSALRCLPGRCEKCSQGSTNATGAAVACCSENRAPAEENPMCARCAEDHVEWGGSCIECKETNWALLGMLLVIMWAVCIIMHLAMNQESNPLSLVFFYYVQMVLLLFGEETGWLAWTSFFNFNPIQNASGGQCVAPWSSLTKLAVSALSPLLTWLFLGLTAVIHILLNFVRRPKKFSRLLRKMTAPYLRSCLAFFLFSYNNVANSTLRFYECVDVGGGQWRVVRSSPDIDCDSDEYARMRPLFGACLLFVAAGPIIIAYWLHRPRILRLAGRVGQHGSFTRARGMTNSPNDRGSVYEHIWGILFEMYKSRRSYVAHNWNAIVLVRRIAIVLVGILMLQHGHRARYAALTLAHLAVLISHLIVKPFRRMTLTGDYVDGDGRIRSQTGVGAGEGELVGDRTVIDVNMLETGSLVLLVVFSAVTGAIDLPFSTEQSIGLGFFTFAWMGVLVSVMLMRSFSKQRAKHQARTRDADHPRTMPMTSSGTRPMHLPVDAMRVDDSDSESEGDDTATDSDEFDEARDQAFPTTSSKEVEMTAMSMANLKVAEGES